MRLAWAGLTLLLAAASPARADDAAACAELLHRPLEDAEVTAAALLADGACRVAGVARPAIRFEVWLPASEAWGGRFEGIGGGLEPAALAAAVGRGAAGMAQDGGEAGQHRAAVLGKEIARAFYARPPRHSYFLGCGAGGREGLVAAQRFPGDYDGILAGAPALAPVASPVGLPAAKLPALHAAAVRACAAASGLIEDPAACRFDPGVLQCRGADGPACLTAGQVETVRRAYAGVPVGSELSWGQPGDGPPGAAVATDLAAFRDRDGRLLVYQGLADAVVPPAGTLDWVAGTAQGGEVLRLFLAPGMAHCGGGPGLNSFGAPGHAAPAQSTPQRDIIAALQFWVETGRAPDSLVASHRGLGVARTGLLCAWPRVAQYRRGPRNAAASYACAPPSQ